ncbi:MAG: hypothetical protein ACK56I_13095, partial [bacterium]
RLRGGTPRLAKRDQLLHRGGHRRGSVGHATRVRQVLQVAQRQVADARLPGQRHAQAHPTAPDLVLAKLHACVSSTCSPDSCRR